MSDNYVGEIRMFGGNFAPVGWQFCDGSLQSISQYSSLFALIGTTYGGDGQSTFAVPNLRGRVPVHMGQGPGLSNYPLGQPGGSDQVTLTSQQLPVHSHTLAVNNAVGDTATPSQNTALASMGPSGETRVNTYIAYDGTSQVQLSPTSIGLAGGSQPHTNLQPTLTINFIIALEGIFPSQ